MTGGPQRFPRDAAFTETMVAPGDMRRAVLALALVLLAVLGSLVAGSAAGAAGTGGTDGTSSLSSDGASPSLAGPALSQLGFDPDSTEIRVALDPDGSADWTVRYGLALEDENDTEAFRDLQDDIATNTSRYLADFRTGITATVNGAENATGREMAATNFSVDTSYDTIQQRGSVTYRFSWTGFAESGGDRIVAGDALAGFFLDEGTTLVVSWPDGYDLASVDPPATESGNAVSWSGGSVTFDAGGPRVVASSGGGTPWLLVGGVVLVLAVLVAGAGLYWGRGRAPTPSDDTAAGGAGAAGAAPAADSESAETGTTAGGEPEEPPDELLSNEERVLRFLEARGGRAKQQEVVSELDWTAAKTSQVVNGMQEDGAVEKFRLGRENVLVLPEQADDVMGGDPE